MEKRNRSAKQRQEVDLLDRVMIWFGASLFYELFLLAVNRYYFHYRVKEIEFAAGLDKLFGALIYITLAACVVVFLWARFGKVRHSLPIYIAGAACGVLGISFWLFKYVGDISVRVLQVIVPVVAVIALIYYLYQKEFFAITTLSGLCILGLWIYRRAAVSHPMVSYGYLIGFCAVSAAVFILAVVLQRGDGAWKLGGQERRVLPRSASYPMVYLTCVLTVLAVAAALALGATIAYYAIFGVIAWIFAMAVYYTVRLM